MQNERPSRRRPNALSVLLALFLLLTVAGAAAAEPGHGRPEIVDEALGQLFSPVVLDATVDMVCFPPQAMISPPCPVPVGLDPELVAPDPAGQMRIVVTEDDTTLVSIRLEGMSTEQVATAFFVHFPPNQPPPHPIFAPAGPGEPPTAFMDTPVAHTGARFSEGLSREPNQFRIRRNGDSQLVAVLDYNPLKSGQVPLVNGLTLTNQASAPAGFGVEQPDCCPDFPAGPRPEPIGASYLRRFDPVTGYQIRDADGRPELVRSPTRPVALAVFIHIDGLTSGLVPGVPTPPFLVDPPSTTGTFYLLGIFPLGPLAMD